jgi:hypothetical protein
MGQIGISITKRTPFRESTQEFNNTYHYGSALPNPSASEAEALLDELVADEKVFHSNQVTFVFGRVWSSGGNQSENQMLFQKGLSGVGAGSTITNYDRERAFLVQWPAGLDSRGHKVYLRKWYHTLCVVGGVTIGQTILENTAGFTQPNRDAMAAVFDSVSRIGAGVEEWGLVAASGRTRDGGLPQVHKFLEHHQLGDQWRG